MWQIIAWSTEKGVPQLHERGVLLRFPPGADTGFMKGGGGHRI